MITLIMWMGLTQSGKSVAFGATLRFLWEEILYQDFSMVGVCKMNKQQEHTGQHSELYSVPYNEIQSNALW